MEKNEKEETKKEEKSAIISEDEASKEAIEESSANQKRNESTDSNSVDSEANEEQEHDEELLGLREEKLRLLAEMENLRKRFDKEKKELIKYGTAGLVREILSPGDNLERALTAIPKDEKLSSSVKNLIEGLKMVQKEFNSILEKNGVKKINSINKKFDHNFHQAMMEVEKDDVEEGTIVEEIQTGYTMHDRLLRAAMVAVSKLPMNKKNKNEKEKDVDKETNKNKENQEK